MYPITSRIAQLNQVAAFGRVFVPINGIGPDNRCTCGRELCESPGKHPIPRGWQNTSEHKTASEAVRWLQQGKNVGIVTGMDTGLLLIDLDDAEAIEWFERSNGDAPYFRVFTGRGAHVYYKHPGVEVRNSVKLLAPGVDVRGERGCVVGPGSIHASGRMYAVDAMSADEPQELPAWLLEAISNASRSRSPVSGVRADETGVIREGGRNQALFSLAGSMRHAGLGYDGILAALRATNEKACDPPLQDHILVGMAERAAEYEPGTPARRIRIGSQTGMDVQAEDGKAPTPFAVANAFQEAMRDTPVVYHRGSWLLHDGVCYNQIQEDAVARMVMLRLQASLETQRLSKRTYVADVVANLSAIAEVPDTVNYGQWIDRPGPLGIIVRNGIVDVHAYLADDSNWLIPHDAGLLSAVCLPFEARQEADCPIWQATLKRVIPEDETRDELQKWFGLNLVPDTSFQKAAVLIGDGANGKSTVLEILAELVGKGNYSTVPLEQFGERFELSAMVGKAANIAHEMGELDKSAEGVLKQLITAEEMRFERKYKDPYMARPTARLTFSTNVLPRITDRTDAIWRRLLIFPFTVTIPEEERDPELLTKLRAELPGIFNWAIEGLDHVYAYGFRESRGMNNVKTRYREAVNPFLQWVEERLEDTGLSSIETARLHEDYRIWCGSSGYHPLSARPFENELERVFKREVSRPGSAGPRPRMIAGLRLRR